MSDHLLPNACNRRAFLKHSLGAATALGLVGSQHAQAAGANSPSTAVAGAIVDVNVSLERWPFRNLSRDKVPLLAKKLRSLGVKRAWAGSFDGLLHKDIASVNSRLVESCRGEGQGLFIPFGSVNPSWPGWEDDIIRCHQEFKMPGIRLHPGYHGYGLNDPRFKRLLELATERDLVVQLAVIMEDERTQHPLLQAPAVDTAPLLNVVRAVPNLRLVVLNSGRRFPGDSMMRLADTGRVYFEISWLEGGEAIGDLLAEMPAVTNHILFGSHAPLFLVESPVLKLKESDLTNTQLRAISSANASRLIPIDWSAVKT